MVCRCAQGHEYKEPLQEGALERERKAMQRFLNRTRRGRLEHLKMKNALSLRQEDEFYRMERRLEKEGAPELFMSDAPRATSVARTLLDAPLRLAAGAHAVVAANRGLLVLVLVQVM